MRLFPRTARQRMFAAVSAGALAMGAMSVPLANADPLDDRRERVEDRLDDADHALDESSARMRRAMAALDSAQQALDSARAELEQTRAELTRARARDEAMQLRLEQAQARLEQAQTELATGRSDLSDQRDAVTELVTSIYQEGDPHLQALNSMINAEDTADLTWAEEARDVVVGQETRAYDELRASEVLLQVREQQVAEAEKQVEVQRQQAAEQLVITRDLTRRARDAKARVVDTVQVRKGAKQSARVARQRDLRDLRQLREEERDIQRLIAERAARAARAAARASRSSGSSGSLGGYSGRTGGFLDYPVNTYVTSPFGYRTHPIYGYYSLHNGTDFGGGCGVPMRAVAGGRVLSRYYSSVYGNRLFLNLGVVNGKNVTAVYNHASGYNVGVGQTVSRGQVIGYTGDTGWSTACHLHFTVLVNGQPVNPMNWL